MTGPQPSLKNMLLHGHTVGLTTVSDAYLEYTRWPDVFFYLPELEQQTKRLQTEITDSLVEGLTITEAMEKLNITLPDDPPDLDDMTAYGVEDLDEALEEKDDMPW